MSERTKVQDPSSATLPKLVGRRSRKTTRSTLRGGETGLFFNFNAPNHGKLFKSLLSAFVPESEQFTDLSRP